MRVVDAWWTMQASFALHDCEARCRTPRSAKTLHAASGLVAAGHTQGSWLYGPLVCGLQRGLFFGAVLQRLQLFSLAGRHFPNLYAPPISTPIPCIRLPVGPQRDDLRNEAIQGGLCEALLGVLAAHKTEATACQAVLTLLALAEDRESWPRIHRAGACVCV